VSPATWPRDEPLVERLLTIDPAAGSFADLRIGSLTELLEPGDLLVVNDGATMPAALEGRTRDGAYVEARLVSERGDGAFAAILFGDGSSRMRTEDRGPAPRVAEGDELLLGDELAATIERVDEASPRLVDLRFRETGARFWSALYRSGRPIQYAYVEAPLELWHTQTRYASRPWCAELASAGRPLTWALLLELRRRGVGVAHVTHAAGISSTGDAALDGRLPMRERYDVPASTVRAVREAKLRGKRVVAVGTTVARALEGCARAHGGELVAASGETDLLIDGASPLRVVDGLLTGMHEPTESHYRLISAFVAPALLERANDHAREAGYLSHEFGDSTLILRGAAESSSNCHSCL
jgi:S-adenosylmethionine:tRNA ribosyltransferase-isomerase